MYITIMLKRVALPISYKVTISIIPKSHQSNWFEIESIPNKFTTEKRQSNKRLRFSSLPIPENLLKNFLINHYRDQALCSFLLFTFPRFAVYERRETEFVQPKCQHAKGYFISKSSFFFHQTRSNCLDKDPTTHRIKFIVCLREHIFLGKKGRRQGDIASGRLRREREKKKMSNETQSKFLSSHQKRINSSHSRSRSKRTREKNRNKLLSMQALGRT